MFPTPSHPLTDVYSCTRRLFWRKYTLNVCTVSCISEIKWFSEHFEVIAYFEVGYYCFVALTVTDGCKTGWIVKISYRTPAKEQYCALLVTSGVFNPPPPPPHVIYNVHAQCVGATWLDELWTRFVRSPWSAPEGGLSCGELWICLSLGIIICYIIERGAKLTWHFFLLLNVGCGMTAPPGIYCSENNYNN